MDRRKFLKQGAAFGVALSTPFSLSLSKTAFAASMPATLTDLSALELSRAIHEKRASCVEVMQAYLAHIHRYNPVYNAIINMHEDAVLMAQAKEADQALARGEDRGWMHGMPHAVKELNALKGFRYTAGSLLFADRVADADSTIAAHIREAGAIFIGKTNTPEFGLGSQSYNPIYGATGSAWNPALTSGGSSGGAASGLGTHMLPVADGSDMMGSLRNPGAFNNVIGFRPSTDVMGGGNGNDRPLATTGPMGRNTADTIALLKTIAVKPLPEQFNPLTLRGVKFGWLGDLSGYLAMEPGIIELCEASLATVGSAGAHIASAALTIKPEDLWQCWTTLRHSGRVSMQNLYDDPNSRAKMKPELIWEIEQGARLTPKDIANAKTIRSNWYIELDRLFGEFDFIVSPSAQVFPFSKDIHWPNQINGHPMDTYHRWMEVVIPGSLGGLPIINVPVGFDSKGRPMGMQIIGRFGADQQVLEFGLAYEVITGFLAQRPKLVAQPYSLDVK